MTVEVSRLRADARENGERILAAARALFSERGLDVGMREVARRAGVGPATLYRRFPTRQDLVDAAFDVELRECRGIVVEGAADPDPWRGFSTVIRRLVALNAQNKGFVDAFVATGASTDAVAQHRRELLGELARLARRAQVAGSLRSDFRIQDLTLVLLAGRGLAQARPEARGPAADRFAELAIDAFRAGRASPSGRDGRVRIRRTGRNRMTDSPVPSFELLAAQLLEDPDLDVSVTATGLHVHGRLFAYLDGAELAVDLPTDRAADLVGREVAAAVAAGRSEAKGSWVRIADAEDWPELAAEAHQFVGEPAVGKDS